MATKRRYKRRTYRKKKRTQKRRRGGGVLPFSENKLNIDQMKAEKRDYEAKNTPNYVRNPGKTSSVEDNTECASKESTMMENCKNQDYSNKTEQCKTAENKFIDCKFPK